MANTAICADGTWNRPEENLSKDHPTNVLRIARAIQPQSDDVNQHVFYDWGLGSYHDSAGAGVTGKGIHKNILDCYRYLVQNYAPGDSIYLFGFSRGAYTVRALSGLIHNCGIIKRSDARLIAKAWKVYKSTHKKNHPNGAAATSFRAQHSHAERDVRFVGVWDTVGALGLPFSFLGLLDAKDEFYDTKMGGNINIARHALAIDEKREDFEPTFWQFQEGVDLKQVWFSGVHSDVGGSYGKDKEGYLVSNLALAWMVDEANKAGLKIENFLSKELQGDKTMGAGHKAQLHHSQRHIFRAKRPLHRDLQIDHTGTWIDPSVKQRYETDDSYRPPQLHQLVETRGWSNLPVGH